MAKTTTVVEEFDKDGNLVKKTTTTVDSDTNTVTIPYYPVYPVYPQQPNWWENPVTYYTTITCNSDVETEK